MHNPHKFTREPDGYTRMRHRLTPKDAALIEAAAKAVAGPNDPDGVPLPLYIKRALMAQVHADLRGAGIDPDSVEYEDLPDSTANPARVRFSNAS